MQNEAAAVCSESHPSLDFYRGNAAVQIRLDSGSTSMHVIRLHRTLLPPADVGELGDVAEEKYAAQIASDDGIGVLRANWRLLLVVLFPCLQPGDPTPSMAGGAAVDGGEPPRDVEAADITEDAVTEIAGWHVTTDDFSGLREPGMMDRIYYSYVVLLRFFGWRMHDEKRGLLDRHRAWEARYQALGAAANGGISSSSVAASILDAPPSPTYGDYDFYPAALQRVLQCFLSVGFLTYAVRLVEFLIEEMQCGRLDFLYAFVQQRALPLLSESDDIDDSHKKRLHKKFIRITESDSD